jgi:hypothetical protein
MHAFVIPAWIWLNAGLLVAAAGWVGFRLGRATRRAPARPTAATAPAYISPARSRG